MATTSGPYYKTVFKCADTPAHIFPGVLYFPPTPDTIIVLGGNPYVILSINPTDEFSDMGTLVRTFAVRELQQWKQV